MTKVYAVTFMKYTDCMEDTIHNNTEDKNIYIGREPFLIFEDDIKHYEKFGNGIRELRFVGYIDK